MANRVRELINGVKLTLREDPLVDGARWTDAELVEYLNDAYDFVLTYAPEANAINSGFFCEAGTRQRIPSDSIRFLGGVRNRDGAMRGLRTIDKSVMDKSRPNWHAEAPSAEQEYVIYDDRDPEYFYVYPPAVTDSNLEIIVCKPVDRHLATDYEDNQSLVKLNDRYAIALRNYILHLCFDKDADDSTNAARAQNYLRVALDSLGIKLQNELRNSPRNPQNT